MKCGGCPRAWTALKVDEDVCAHFDRLGGHFEGTFVPAVPRPGEKPEGREGTAGGLKSLVLQGWVGDGKKK